VLFNSYIFWAFFAIVFVLYRTTKHRAQNLMLLVASYIFYGWWDWRFLGLILVCTSANFIAGWQVSQTNSARAKKLWLLFACAISLGLLGFFKYAGFFADQFGNLMTLLGWPLELGWVEKKILLPVGISFFTFQAMSYTIDVYRNQIKATRRFLDFALYVSFFPQLVAGPIERGSHLLPQVLNPRPRRGGDFSAGLYLVLMGLFKKVVIADNMSAIVDTVFATQMSELSGLECLVGVYAFAFQIYGDFAGYSDIARGVSKWLGFDLMLNFRMPYFATTPSDFWRRWHISLSTWLRDYLYIPLGGNRGGSIQTYRNLILTMLLGGLWHGAGWTFVAWGLFHGVLLCVYRPFEAMWRKASQGSRRPWWRTVPAALIMFHLVCVGWLLFRADTIGQAYGMLVKIVTDLAGTPFAAFQVALILFYAAPLVLFELWLERSGDVDRPVRVAWPIRAAVYSYVAIMLLLFHPEAPSAFIYFQF